MKLDPTKFVVNEEKSNHAVAAMSTTECTISEACFGVATGFGGGMLPMCPYFEVDGETAECSYAIMES